MALVISVFSIWFTKLGYLLLVAMALWWSVPRLRDAGQNQLMALALGIALLPAATFWSRANMIWLLGFDMHIGNVVTPTVTAGMACLLGVALMPSTDEGSETRTVASGLAGTVVGQAILTAFATALVWLMQAAFAANAPLPSGAATAITGIYSVASLLMTAIPAVVLYFGYRQLQLQVQQRGLNYFAFVALAGLVCLASAFCLGHSLSVLLGMVSPRDGQRFMTTMSIRNYVLFAQLLCLIALFFLIDRAVGRPAPAQTPHTPPLGGIGNRVA